MKKPITFIADRKKIANRKLYTYVLPIHSYIFHLKRPLEYILPTPDDAE